MIVLLDTTVFVADPHCGGTAWRVLAHAASAWDVRLLVPEVVIKEAVAGYRRRTEEALVGLQRQKEKHGGALGISSVYDDARARIDAEALGYPETLHRLLDDIGAQTVSPPEISHMELVERATQRRKPCDGSGNGYRDTLNWISVLNAAKEFNEDIAWVSDNTTDFGREEGEGLHDDLAAEVRDIGAEGRVAWFRSLSDLILELTNERWPEFSDDLRRIQERLQSDSMESYLNEQTLASCVERSLSSSSCGFPLDARSATVKAVGALTDLTLSVRGASEEGEGIVEFVAVCPTTALVTLPITADVEGLEVESVAEDRVTVWISKDLHFAGIITSDGYGRPVSGEVTKVAASPDDPGRRVWARRPASNSLRDSVESMRRPLIDSRILESMRRPLIDPTILQSIRRPLIDPTILQSIRRPLIDPTILQSIRRPLIDPTILQSMRPSLIDPSILERMRNPIPGIEALKDSRKAGRNDVDVGLGAEDAVSEEGETLDQDDDASDEG